MRPGMTEHEAQVWERLERVMDPELDEPVTEMGFVESVMVDDANRSVSVEFRLPTYWCSPNFAFLMAFDMRTGVEQLDWVRGATVTLNDHCFADRINSGVNGGRDFNSVFSEYCNGDDLSAVRLKFLEKAFVRRQETVLLALQKQGLEPSEITAMTMHELDQISFQDDEANRQKHRYRSLLVSRALATRSTDPAFVTWDNERLKAEGLRDYLSRSRGVRINMEFNGALCRGLKDARYKELSGDTNSPIPIKFVRHAVLPEGQKAMEKALNN